MNICRQLVLGSSFLVALATTARAEKLYSVETNGIELEVPAGWGKTAKGELTMLAPKAYKGRAIEVVPLKAMPAATPEAFTTLLGSDKLELKKVNTVERDGVKFLGASGKVALAKATGDVDILVVPTPTAAVMLLAFTRGDQDPMLREANRKIMLSARPLGPRITVTFAPPKTKGMVGAPPEFVEWLQKLGPSLDHDVRFPRLMPIKIEECGIVNAFYSPPEHQIHVCHELFDELVKMFTGAGIPEDKARVLTSNTIKWVFFHELGHALVGELGLGITGRGEDAADELATVMLSQFEEGRRAAVDAARWFDVMSKQPKKNIFWDTHSMDGQRVISIVCLLYGADKARYQPLMKALQVPAARLGKCTRDFPLRMKAWQQLLLPHARKKPLPA